MKIYTGHYMGDGVEGRLIACPLDPKLIIVKRNGASAAIWKSDTMSANRSSFFGGSTDITTGIQTIETGGFTIGAGNEVNADGEEYNFIAFEAEAGDIETGSYSGNGTDSTNISFASAHSAAPILMWLKEQLSTDPVIQRDGSNSSDSANILSSTPSLNQTNLIQSVSSSAFQVGDDSKVNTDGAVYHWVAFFADTDALVTSTYTGDGADNRMISNIGLDIDLLLVFNKTTGIDPVLRFREQSTNESYPLIAAADGAANQIQEVTRDDFQVGTHAAVNTNAATYRYFAFKTTNWAVSGKYHVSIDGLGYVLQHKRNGEPLYEKKPTQDFVSKFGSGDSSYRDSSFWQFWAQVNWRNGSKQLRFDDAGKFWKSDNIDVTQLEALKLSKEMISAGQIRASTKVKALAGFRSSQSWWDANYGYRQRLTVTAPSTTAIPVGYPIKVTVDSAALQTAGKVRSDRKDWRIVYFNGSNWVDLKRDYITTTLTVFAVQAEIAAGQSDSNYYLHYGYSSESTDKQPSTDADWNEVYGMYGGAAGSSIDANTLGVWHGKEGSGTTIADTDSTNDMSWSDNSSWNTTGPFGRSFTTGSGGGSTEDTAPGVSVGAGGELDVGSFTIEAWRKSSQGNFNFINYGKDSNTSVKFKIQYDSGTKIYFEKRTGPAVSQQVTSSNNFFVHDSAWHHYAIAFDGGTGVKFYRDGVLIESQTLSGSSGIRSVAGRIYVSRDSSGTDSFAHIRMSNNARTSFPYATVGSITASNEAEQTTTPPESSFSLYAGLSDGSIHLWDGNVSWTEVFNVRRLEWFETGTDTTKIVGDTGGTETAQAQKFQVDANVKMKAVQVHLKKNAGTPGDITVRIETDNAGVPSGTLVNASATATIPAFTTATSDWITVEFPDSFSLTGATAYWIVLKTAAAANDNNYAWTAKSSSGYADGNAAHSTDGGSTWSADAAIDLYFRVLGNATSINCALLTKVGSTQKIQWGTGDPTGEVNGDARLYSWDGTTWKLEKIFATATESAILSLSEYLIGGTANLMIGIAPQAKVYLTSDLSTYTLSKDINTPQNPGYPYALFEYNKFLFAAGGSPEFLDDAMYNGFFFAFDQVDWNSVLPFDFTVIKSMQFYDAFLFLGSYHGQLFVFNTVTLDPLFSFSDDYEYAVQIWCQLFFDDKLWIGLVAQNDITPANEGLWMFDRHGMSQYSKISGVEGYYSLAQVNNQLFVGTGDDGYVYRLSRTTYAASGSIQSSYFDALLPSMKKLYSEFLLQFDPLPAGTSITVYYKFRESDSWTALGSTINTTGLTEKTLSFPSGVVSKKISFRIDLATSNNLVTPVIREHILKYAVYPQRKWQWNLRILAKDFAKLLDDTRDPRTGLQIKTDIESAQQSEALNTFVDVDGKSYTVLFHTLDEDSQVINQDKEGAEGSVAVTLLEA